MHSPAKPLGNYNTLLYIASRDFLTFWQWRALGRKRYIQRKHLKRGCSFPSASLRYPRTSSQRYRNLGLWSARKRQNISKHYSTFKHCLVCFGKREKIGIINSYGCSGYFMNFPSSPQDPPHHLGEMKRLLILCGGLGIRCFVRPFVDGAIQADCTSISRIQCSKNFYGIPRRSEPAV